MFALLLFGGLLKRLSLYEMRCNHRTFQMSRGGCLAAFKSNNHLLLFETTYFHSSITVFTLIWMVVLKSWKCCGMIWVVSCIGLSGCHIWQFDRCSTIELHNVLRLKMHKSLIRDQVVVIIVGSCCLVSVR